MRKFIAGVATVDMLVGNNIIATAQTLLDSSIDISSSSEDVRGGIGNKLLAKYYHTSVMDINLTDVQFKLEYIAFQTGSTITNGSDIFGSEQVTIMNNKGTLQGTPVTYNGAKNVWVSLPGEDAYQTVAVTGKEFDYAATDGTVVCVKYVRHDNNAKQIIVSSNFIPDEVTLVMKCNLYKAGRGDSISSSSKIGEVQILVPRFQFNGTQNLSLTSSGVANMPISGSALDNPSIDCSEGGYYAIITELTNEGKWYDNIKAIAVEDSDVDIYSSAPGNTQLLKVLAVPAPGAGSAFYAPVEDLQFTSDAAGTATVDTEGLVTAAGEGSTTITITVKEKAELQAVANVTVTAH